MAISKTAATFTYADYLTWPTEERWELIEGQAWDMSPAPTRRHQELSKRIEYQIEDYLKDKHCRVYDAPFDVRLPEAPAEPDGAIATVVQPDIVVVCDQTKLDDAGCRGAPDWIIEVLSEQTAKKDEQVKFALYEKHGVREYWIVDPANRIVRVFCLSANGRFERTGVYEPSERIAVHAVEGLVIDLEPVFKP